MPRNCSSPSPAASCYADCPSRQGQDRPADPSKCIARGDEAERSFWREAIEGRRVSDEDLAHATRLLRAHNAIDDTFTRARHYGQRAIDALGPFPGGKAKAALVEAFEFAIARAY